MKRYTLLFSLIFSVFVFGQNNTNPIYKDCESINIEDRNNCFTEGIQNDFLTSFKVPNDVNEDKYKGRIVTYFTVTTTGDYKINYISSNYQSVKTEIQRVFSQLPKVTPTEYNGNPTESDYVLPFLIPIEDNYAAAKEKLASDMKLAAKKIKETEQLNKNPEISSSLNIPFTHELYQRINTYYSTEENNHSAVKPYIFSTTTAYKKIERDQVKLYKETDNLLAKKLWNDNFFTVKDKDFWFMVNPIIDWQIGKDNSNTDYTFNNTRALNVKGSIGKFSFSTSYYESQGRFAKYINDYQRYLKPGAGHAIVLGRGLSKKFKEDSFDYPVAEAYISYSPNKIFNFQFGNGKNFIGDGYRSLLLSDVAAPYTYAKISTTFWKIKYTNLWMWMRDVRPEVMTDGTTLRKYAASHHLSMNITKKLNIGFFESTITNKRSNPTMDIDFLNPLIFYRAVEYSRGSQSGNAMIGLNAKYQLKENFNIYGQFVLDELIVSELFKNDGFWANKFGFQLGANYYNAFNVKNLSLQVEANIVRPFTYSHSNSELNYSHYLQPLAHPWGSNFVEAVAIARYHKNRWFGNIKLIAGKKGFDFNDTDTSYGGDLFQSYNDRPATYDNTYYQGNTATILNMDLQAGYLINPSTNLKAFGNFNYRNFNAEQAIPYFTEENTMWFSLGLKTDLFNSYSDF